MASNNSLGAKSDQPNKVGPDSSWFKLLKQTSTEWSDDDAPTWAAAVACYTLLALAPLLIIAIRFLSIFLNNHVAPEQIQAQAKAWMGPTAGDAITEIVNKASQPGTGKLATVISIVLAVVSVGGIFAELQQAMNRIWKLKVKPGGALMAWVRARLLSVVVVIVSALLVLASVVATAWIGKITESLGIKWKYLSVGIDVIASVVVVTLLFALLYRTLPDAHIEWRTTWVGAFLSGLLFVAGKYGLALYFKYAAPASAFGAMGSLAAVLIWIYYSCMIVFFGAEFTQVFAKARGHGVHPSAHAQTLSEFNETESATPSKLPPLEKPQRPAKEKPDTAARSPKPFAPVWAGSTPHPAGTSWVPAVTAITGAVLGGLSIYKLQSSRAPIARDLAAAKLNARLRRVEHSMENVSDNFSDYLHDAGVNARIQLVQRRIRQAKQMSDRVKGPSRGANTWLSRVANAIRHAV